MVKFRHMLIIIVIILGLIVGSLLNAVIYRLRSGDKLILSRSKCVHCQHSLGIGDLIPILSFILLKRRCRYCQKPISWQYPLVEFFCAIIFILGYFRFLHPYLSKAPAGSVWSAEILAPLPAFLIFLVFSSFLIIIFVYDLKHYLILDQVTLSALVFAFIANYLLGFTLGNLLIASLIIAGFFLLQFIISKGKWIGGGDIRLGLVMGAMLGWPNGLVALFLAYILGAMVGLILIAGKQKHLGDQLPFGTFLSLATVITLLYGEAILKWSLTQARLL